MSDLLIAKCRCKQEAWIPGGLEFGESRQKMIDMGWRYGGNSWRCSECHQKWASKQDKEWLEGRKEHREEVGA